MGPESQSREAAERARAAVAAAPRDESAAERLREVVQQYQRDFPNSKPEATPTAPEIVEARRLIDENELEEAEILLRKHLAIIRNDPPAMHMMAEIAAYCGLRADSDRILDHSSRLHVDDPDALVDLAATLRRIAVHEDIPELIYKAAAVFDRALEIEPAHERGLALKAEMMMQTRGLDQAHAACRKLVSLQSQVAAYWIGYGYLLKTLGEAGEGVAAIRTALALDPGNGSGWWTLADLKNVALFESDIAQMEAALERDDLPDGQRVPLHFALAKALDSAGEFERAIEHIELGSEIRGKTEKPKSKSIIGRSAFIRETFTQQFFDERQGWGDQRSGPIFIVGMHRAGSTLVEQILSSHSQIEGSEELFIINTFSNELALSHPDQNYGDTLRALENEDFKLFGQRYFEISSRSRRTRRPFLTDKYPGNWKFIGLIHCMLPNARIIDVRRNPMDCCFANYFRYYGSAADHSFSQSGMGRYYADYVAAMRHFDEVLPGRVHRLIHDDLVDDLEGEVRRLLNYVGVPFDEACLRFYETERAVHTPSSEQVRRPINRAGFGKWRNYEPWLGDLKGALGETLGNWRE
ncbi:tetratricopeptide repeat-containing sulfotransferase family protein [Sphingomonas sp. URHD0057]|uniref:tetratricopeptide repeat-containing sulfotransferase family protein n=1 Tax=Sphingomonas sp. URHD0057 TaxID=1380389 RepID=UPI0018CC1347|nr:tetratricopeptide repeat-containing sulfotransferase family protein [Sphingomonas sp. URHD0057]